MNINELKILVAEDNPVNILLMKKLLAKWEITSSFAKDGFEVLAALENSNFDLILLDLQMPNMDGYEAARMIRKNPNPQKASVHIIAFTASLALEVRHQIAASGINDMICKPFHNDELKEKLAAVAKRLSEGNFE